MRKPIKENKSSDNSPIIIKFLQLIITKCPAL